jgi:hypothetical protein
MDLPSRQQAYHLILVLMVPPSHRQAYHLILLHRFKDTTLPDGCSLMRDIQQILIPRQRQ